MNAVWMVRSRQMASQIRFWTALVGYDPRDRSIGQNIYLVYLAVFFSLWGFAVLALLADLGAGVLVLFRGISPATTATMIIAIVLLVDAFLKGYRSTKRSPFLFSDEDAGLICQTPVDRRQVAFAWMVTDWLTVVWQFVALAVVLSFANIQLTEPGGVQWAHIPQYWLEGMRVASIVLPIHLGFTSIDYALGALRLRGDQENSLIRFIPAGLALILLSLIAVYPSGFQAYLWPVWFPVSAALGEASWLAGWFVAALWALSGLCLLYGCSSRLNLSRAAQESHTRWIYQQVSWLGDAHLARQMRRREKLGSGHLPSRLPGWPGAWSLVWKDWVTNQRAPSFRHLYIWLGIFFASLGLMLPLGSGVHLNAFVIWSVLVSQRGIERLRGDLGLWMITRQLPIRTAELIVLEVAQPLLSTVFISWLAGGVSAWLGYTPDPTVFLFIPVASLCIVLSAVFDVLRRCRSADLLAGNAADLGAGGLLMGMIFAGVPMLLFSWAASHFDMGWIPWLIGLAGLGFGSAIAYGVWRLTLYQYQRIK
jgi:hypothetical protein